MAIFDRIKISYNDKDSVRTTEYVPSTYSVQDLYDKLHHISHQGGTAISVEKAQSLQVEGLPSVVAYLNSLRPSST